MSVLVIFLVYPSSDRTERLEPGWNQAKLPPIVENIRSCESAALSPQTSSQNRVLHPLEIKVRCSTDILVVNCFQGTETEQ